HANYEASRQGIGAAGARQQEQEQEDLTNSQGCADAARHWQTGPNNHSDYRAACAPPLALLISARRVRGPALYGAILVEIHNERLKLAAAQGVVRNKRALRVVVQPCFLARTAHRGITRVSNG